MSRHVPHVCQGGQFARRRSPRALRARDLSRPQLSQRGCHRRVHPEWRVRRESGPPRLSVGVAAIGRVLYHPARPRLLRLAHEPRGEVRQLVVLAQVARPPRRCRRDPRGLRPRPHGRMMRHQEGCARGRSEDHVKSAPHHPSQDRVRDLLSR
eukprot:39380-Pleurochrysis_carterae.AAC.1